MDKTFYIFRHGLAVKPGEEYGDRMFTAGLLPEGKHAIKKIGEYLKSIDTNHNVSSEIPRCKQSAEIVTEISGKEFTFDTRLNEFHAESFGSVEERVKSFFDEITHKNYKKILICTHGAIIGALKSFILTGNMTANSVLDFPESGVLLIIKEKTVRELNFR